MAHDRQKRTLGEFWSVLREEAEIVVRSEPFLAPVLQNAVLRWNAFSDALARRLCDALGCHEVARDTYGALFSDTIKADPTISTAAAQDLFAIYSGDPASLTFVQAFLSHKAFHAVQMHRIAHRLWLDDRRELALWLMNRASMTLGPDIHPAARLGVGLMLDHGAGIVIGETAVVEDHVTILQNVTLGGTGKIRGDRHPKVRQGVMIGAGAKIIGNIEIGAFSKVGAGSVVLKDVPARCTVAGVPARVVRLHPQSTPDAGTARYFQTEH
ncbi:serine O-acetyltransferase [Roseobacter denitrificans]|uniref:Serine acetyltransferase n=1 Tax=Roseobacter denitrificans (strain ATCC 33942 / OCh 114) TaxID=375451 RepID=Q16B58_ROSDO|nr:serine O-acetyltransferase [Roseobacter denitrificans]ABG30785.1 serine acetyltransferase [Roseobacter denitrificans OCh 114]AVL53893.1 serine O-acetyltransferase [Roseobacter denitrificans]SFG46729.1 serine O-acetyltransferase [Roseobacter denitrificans OCh 114]